MFGLIRRPSPALVVACIALLVALTGTGVAAVSQLVPRSSVGTAQLKNDAVVSAKVKNGSLRRADFKSGQIPAGATGPAGPAGAAGAAGPAGPAGAAGPAGTVTKLTAVANSSGSLARSQGTTSAGHVGTGQYEVIFSQNVTACTYVASVGNPTPGATTPNGWAVVVPRNGNANGVGVATYNSAGALTDLPFHLVVVC